MTNIFDESYTGRTFYRPEPYYYWFYFVFMNAFWIVIPCSKYPVLNSELKLTLLVCVYSSAKATAKAFKTAKMTGQNGSAKKHL
jgi:cholestenol delta-isomerase